MKLLSSNSMVSGACLILIALLVEIHCSRILLIPLGNKSHLFELDGIGRELLARRHEVYIVMSRVDVPPRQIAERGYHFLIYSFVNESTSPQLPGRDLHTILESGESHLLRFTLNHWEDGQYFMEVTERVGVDVLRDEPLFERLHALQLDLVVAQYSGVFITWPLLVARKLALPYVGQTSELTPWSLRLPVLPGSDTNLFSAWLHVRPDDLPRSLWQRTLNLVSILLQDFVLTSVFRFDRYRTHVAYDDIRDVQGAAELTLVDHDHLLDDPVATLPHVLMVGGLATSSAQALPRGSLRDFLDADDSPFIVCSFGSLLDGLSSSIVRRLFDAFDGVKPLRVVMRINPLPLPCIPSNVFVASWIPQNDLLGHRLVRAFVTHSGNNGQYEALYHAVPMVAFYAFADQLMNADRVARRGYGVKMDALSKFTSKQLSRVILDVVYNESYRNAISKASRIFHSDRHPATRAAEAIERIVAFGGHHLKPHLSFQYSSAVQLYGVDILLLFFAACAVFLVAVLLAAVKLIKTIAGRKAKLD